MAITIKSLLAAGDERLALELISGEEYIDRDIEERALNRPGLALSGFFKYFAQHRLQVFGLAELTYLRSLSALERRERLRPIFKKNVPGIIIARNRNPSPEMLSLSKEYKIPLLKTSMITHSFVNECTVLIEDLMAPKGRINGTAMDLGGIGVIIQGPAGIGKSETALSLIERGYSLVSDDVTEVVRASNGKIVGYASDLTRYHMELRGVGIVHVSSIFGVGAIRRETEIDIVIHLHHYGPEDEDKRDGHGPGPSEINVLGSDLPFYDLPVSPGRSMVNLVETVALNHKMKLLGHDAAKELDEKLIKRFVKRRR